MTRPDWNTYFLDLAKAASTRATCSRLQVGCVLVRARVIVSTGYNGAARGDTHCGDMDHTQGHCERSVHAEANAIALAAREGLSSNGTIAYVTHRPCQACYRLLLNAGVTRVIYAESYGDPYIPLSVSMEKRNV